MLLAAAETATETTTVTWTTPTVVVAIIAPIVALLGVLISNWWNGRNAIKAEDKRHANALVAESVRHQNALAAEDKRHANTLRQLTHSTVVTKTNDLYAEIEVARYQLFRSASSVGHALHSPFAWNKHGQDSLAKFSKALAQFGKVRARSALTASGEVAAICDAVWLVGFRLEVFLYGAEPEITGSDGEKFLEDALEQKKILDTRLKYLLQRMRQELHGSP